MDDVTSRFRSAYDALLQNQPDPPQFDSISVQTLEDSKWAGRRKQRKPQIAFIGGVAAVAALGLILWIGGAFSKRLPPPLDSAQSIDLEWRPADGIDTGFDRIEFATGSDGSLAVAMSWSQQEGATLDGIYRSEKGIRWTEVGSDGFEGLDQLTSLLPYTDGYIASGIYRDDEESRPALWTTPDAADWDRILLPLPDQDPEAVISYGIGPVAHDSVEAFALGQFIVNRPAEGGAPQLDEQGNPVPADQGGFLWETDRSGAWRIADTTPNDPLFLTDGPAGPVLISSTGEGTRVWLRVDGSWSRSATVPKNAAFLEVALLGNEAGYLMMFEDGQAWFSGDAIEWTPIDDSAFPGSEFDRPALLSAGPGGFVVTSTASLVVSWSDNGMEWTEVANADDLDVGSFSGAAVHDRAISLAVSTGSAESIERFVLTGTVAPDD